MDELNFSNGNKFNLGKLRSGSQIDDKNIFLKKYDKNGNSVFDVEELEQLKTDLKNAAGEDKKLDKNEAINLFARILGIDKTKAQEMNKDTNLVETSILEQIKQQVRETAVKQIQNNNNQAMEIYQQAVGGVISRGWNGIKELFNSEYTQDKVYRQIATQTVSGILLEKAQKGGITRKEYIESKILLLKGLLGADKLSKKDQEEIEKSISNMTMREIESLIVTLKNAENEEYPKLVEKSLNKLREGNKNNDGGAFSVENPNSVGALLKTSGEEILDFDQIYLLEQGVIFNEEYIQEYENKAKVVQGLAILNNIVAEINYELDEPLKNLENINRFSGTPKQLYKDLSTAILNSLKKLYGDNENTIKEKLKEFGGENATLKDGVIEFGEEGDNRTLLANLAKKIKSDLQENLKNALDGKTMEEYEAELKEAHDFAYGAKNTVDLAEKFQENQMEGIGYAKMGASALGTAVMIVTGTGIIPIIASTGLGILGSIGVSYTEAQTKKNGISPEDKKAILEELKTTFKLMPAGMFAGGVANNVCKSLLLKHCPTFLAKCAEIGTDASLSLLADLTITGEIDLKGEGFAQIMSIVQGIILENKMAAKMGGKNPNLPTARLTDGKYLLPPYNKLDWEQISVIKYMEDQLKAGKVSKEVKEAIDARIDSSDPYVVFKYIEKLETPEQIEAFVKAHTRTVTTELRGKDGKMHTETYEMVFVEGCEWGSPEIAIERIKHIKNLQKFLDTQSIPETIKVRRHDNIGIMEQIKVGDTNLAELMQEAIRTGNPQKVLEILNKGGVSVKYDNFVGTAVKNKPELHEGSAPIQWELTVPKGSKGAFLEQAVKNNIQDEMEFLLQTGTKFKIISAEFKDGIWFIKAEVDQTPDINTKAIEEPKTKSTKSVNDGVGFNAIESKLAFFKDIDGEPIFKESDIEVIKATYNEEQIAKLELIIDTILQNETQGQFRMINAADKIKAVLNNIGNKELDFALEILNFKNKDGVLLDCEYDNIFQLIAPRDIPNMKALMELAKEKGTNPLLQDINNLLVIASDCRNYSPSEIRQLIKMKNPDGSFVINKDNYFDLAKNKFKNLNLELTPERRAEVETKLEDKYKHVLKEDELQTIKSAIKDPRTARIIDKILDMQDSDGYKAFDLETIKTTAEFINKNPDKLDILEKLIKQREDTILYNQKHNKHDAGFKVGYKAILEFINDDASIKIVNELLNRPLDEFYWRPLGGVCYKLQNAPNPQKAKGLILEIMKKYPEDRDLEILNQLHDDVSYNLLAKILASNDKNNYNYFDIQTFLGQYQYHKPDFPEYAVALAKAIDKGASPQSIKSLRFFLAIKKKQGVDFIDCSINLGALKNKNGDHKFSEHSLLLIIRKANQKGLDGVALEKLIKENPDATTHELLKILDGENITPPAKYKYPFGENGIFKNEYERIIQTDIWKKLPHDVQTKMYTYLSDLVQKDPNRFERLVNSGYFELCSEGKCNIYDLIKNLETNKFFSKHYLEDVKRLYSGDPLVKEFPKGADLKTVAKEVPSGEPACVDGKMYVNEDGVMKPLNISKEKFEELFPLEGRFNTHQGNLGDCWLISALDNLMDLPIGRAKLFQMISQDGDDLVITFPNKNNEEPIQIRFPKGEIQNSLSGKQLYGCKGLSLIEKAYSIMRGRDKNSQITKYEMESIVDIDAQMKVLEGGVSEEFISAILGYNYKESDYDYGSYVDKTGNVRGTRYDFPDELSVDEAIDIIKALANNDKALLHASTLHLPKNSTKLEKTLSAPNDLYSNHAYTIKGFNEERGLVYFTNPWNANQIVEMDVYTFLGYIDNISYMEL